MCRNRHETESFIIIRKCDIAKSDPANITKSKKMRTRKANVKYNDINKTSQSRTFILKFNLLCKFQQSIFFAISSFTLAKF